MDDIKIPLINLNSVRSRNFNKVLITETKINYDLKKSVRNLKLKKKKELDTFHTDFLKSNFKSTFYLLPNQSQSTTNFLNFKNSEEEVTCPSLTPRENQMKNTYNSKFFYKGISSIVKSKETVSDFIHKTQSLRRMKYITDVQKEQILRTKEEPENKLEGVKDKLVSLKDSKKLFEDNFLPTFDRYIKVIGKQVDTEKYILTKISSENKTLENEVKKLEYEIRGIRDKVTQMREYKMFLHCLNVKKSLASMKLTENNMMNMSRKSSFNQNSSISPKKSIRLASIFKISLAGTIYSHDEPVEYEPDKLINQFNILEKEIIDLMKVYDMNQMNINQTNKEMYEITEVLDDENDENKKAKELYRRVKKQNEELRREKMEAEQVKHRLSNTEQLKDIVGMISKELPILIPKFDEEGKNFKKNLQYLYTIEKSIDFLLNKYNFYKNENFYKNPLKEIEKQLDKARKTRQFLKKKEELDVLNEKRIQKEQIKYLEQGAKSKSRKIAPRIKPYTTEVIVKTNSSLNLREEFRDFIMY